MSQSFTRKYRLHGTAVLPYKETEGSVVEKIPAALYTIKEMAFGGYYLDRKADAIALPEKIYGSTKVRSERAFAHFDKTKESITVGLFGQKGAGKTLLTNYMANEAINRGIPVIDVSDSFDIDKDYLEFIESLGEVFVIFDEFLKHLSQLNNDNPQASSSISCPDKNAILNQDKMLTFLQGTNNTRRFTVLIDNQSYSLSDYIKDRPGRMRYLYNYKTIEAEVVSQLAADYGLDEQKTEALVVYSQQKYSTFDVIKSVVEEWVAYPNETLEQITGIMNVPQLYKAEDYQVIINIKGPTPEGVIFTEGTIGTLSGNNELRFEIKRKNAMYGQDILKQEDFKKNSRLRNDYDDDYDDYVAAHKEEFIIENISMNSRSLVGIRKDTTAYKWFDKTIIEATVIGHRIATNDYSYFSSMSSDEAFLLR